MNDNMSQYRGLFLNNKKCPLCPRSQNKETPLPPKNHKNYNEYGGVVQ